MSDKAYQDVRKRLYDSLKDITRRKIRVTFGRVILDGKDGYWVRLQGDGKRMTRVFKTDMSPESAALILHSQFSTLGSKR
jgi:hypothetical protein